LINRVCDRVREQGRHSLLLSTRCDLPWNAPYYARLGFVEISSSDYDKPAIRERYNREAQSQDMSLRVIMRKLL
jgi:hypothetical protein